MSADSILNFWVIFMYLLLGFVCGVCIDTIIQKKENERIKQEHIDDFRSGYNAATDYCNNLFKDYEKWFHEGWESALRSVAEEITRRYREAEYDVFYEKVMREE